MTKTSIIVQRGIMALAGICLIASAGGCATTTSIDEAVPQSASAVQPDPLPVQAEPVPVESDVATDEFAPAEITGANPDATGKDGFPNLNVKPDAAGDQLTDNDKEAQLAELRAAKARQSTQSGGGSPAEIRRLRELARTHADETLKEIEAD